MLHQNLRASHTKNVQEGAPALSEFLGPVFVDCDPEQGVEDEYKHKHQKLFSWRMLRAVAEVELNVASAVS